MLQCKVCDACPAGYVRAGCSGSSEGTCEPCAAGFFKAGSKDWDAKCQACPKGTHQPQRGQQSCLRCQHCGLGLVRRACSGAKAGHCERCAAGRYKDRNGSWNTLCLHCPSGQFAGQAGSAKCKSCAFGTYQKQRGQLECVACAACPSGHFLSACGVSSEGTCEACRPGTFKPDLGEWNDVCQNCAAEG